MVSSEPSSAIIISFGNTDWFIILKNTNSKTAAQLYVVITKEIADLQMMLGYSGEWQKQYYSYLLYID